MLREFSPMTFSLRFRAAVVSIVLFAAFLGIWHLATRGTGAVANMTPEYAKLMGLTATVGKSAMPGPLDVGAKLWQHLRQPFYDKGPNDKGLGIQLGYSIGRVRLGSPPGPGRGGAARLPALGLFPPVYQGARTRSFKCCGRSRRSPGCRSRSTPSAIAGFPRSSSSSYAPCGRCSSTPRSGRRTCARNGSTSRARSGSTRSTSCVHRILPASVPMIMTGMRISIGIAWFVIVAAEMLVGGRRDRLLHLERVEQPVAREHDCRHRADRRRRPAARLDPGRFTRRSCFRSSRDGRPFHFHRRHREGFPALAAARSLARISAPT